MDVHVVAKIYIFNFNLSTRCGSSFLFSYYHRRKTICRKQDVKSTSTGNQFFQVFLFAKNVNLRLFLATVRRTLRECS